MLISYESSRERKAAEMDEKEENATENVHNRQEREDSCEKAFEDVTRKEDLTSFFEKSDHSRNEIYFSDVSECHYTRGTNTVSVHIASKTIEN